MGKNEKVARRQELSFLGDLYREFVLEKTTAREEALREVELKIESRRKDLARMVWECKQREGVTFSDIEAVTGMSRPTVYRLHQEHIDNSGGSPLDIAAMVADAKAQQRFKYVGARWSDTSKAFEIEFHDTVTGKNDALFIDWKNNWATYTFNAQWSRQWDDTPELDLLIEQVESGRFVPVEDVEKLEANVQARISSTGAAIADSLLDDWG